MIHVRNAQCRQTVPTEQPGIAFHVDDYKVTTDTGTVNRDCLDIYERAKDVGLKKVRVSMLHVSIGRQESGYRQTSILSVFKY